ncbi:MAG: type II toxin-antitoxin system prevent-host-death family antitoxin [Gordonia sp. (in: high G+C Gram-positive bacteria)]|uniref:type II toxin-antitoxin system prevent-host-death family antitoxin n=1 Tax=Gordonia sp. (in: high G+C Gram-positive bacteria) TaxID=84139 RepID=UPI003BB6B901
MTTAHKHRTIAVAELRSGMSNEIARAFYKGERTVITKNGKAAAALISAEDLAYFEHLEDMADVRAYDEAKEADDGSRFTMDDILAEVDA